MLWKCYTNTYKILQNFSANGAEIPADIARIECEDILQASLQPCTAGIHAAVYSRHTCSRVQHAYMQPCTTGIHAAVYNRHTCTRAQQAYMQPCTTGIHAAVTGITGMHQAYDDNKNSRYITGIQL